MADNGIPTLADLEAHIGEVGSHGAGLRPILAGVLDLIAGRAGGVYIGPAKSIAAILAGGAGRAPRRFDSPANEPRGKLALYLPSPPAPVSGTGSAVTLVEIRTSPGGTW
jgi:hypothetical protein